MARSDLGKKKAFVGALVTGASVSDASALVGRSERTGRRWLVDDPLVRDAVREAQDVLLHELVLGTLGRARDSMATLEGLRDNLQTAAYVRVSAAKALADYGLKVLELVALADRVASIERRLEAVE